VPCPCPQPLQLSRAGAILLPSSMIHYWEGEEQGQSALPRDRVPFPTHCYLSALYTEQPVYLGQV